MQHFKVISLIAICLSLLFTRCVPDKNNKNKTVTDGTFLYSEDIRYAKGFSIHYYEEFTKVILNNPWSNSNKPYAEYYLYKNDNKENEFNIPINSLLVNTFSYFEFLSLLYELDSVTGVTDGFRIYNKTILNKLDNKTIVDLGDPFNPNIEKTIELSPDAVISSAYAQIDSYSERIIKAGIPVIYSLEWMENTPLAKAEWIKMIAAFYDKRELADSLFNEIERRYISIKEKVTGIDKRKSVLAGDNFQGTWYLPGGDSFNAALFKDAGLEYLYANNNQRGSIGLDIESVLTQFNNADIWFGCEADTYEQLAEKDNKYTLLDPVKKRQVYNNHNRITPTGGNDYFESAIAYPDLILSDIVKAAYPELLPDYTFSYIKPLN